jgi:hypothetical protein
MAKSQRHRDGRALIRHVACSAPWQPGEGGGPPGRKTGSVSLDTIWSERRLSSSIVSSGLFRISHPSRSFCSTRSSASVTATADAERGAFLNSAISPSSSPSFTRLSRRSRPSTRFRISIVPGVNDESFSARIVAFLEDDRARRVAAALDSALREAPIDLDADRGQVGLGLHGQARVRPRAESTLEDADMTPPLLTQ